MDIIFAVLGGAVGGFTLGVLLPLTRLRQAERVLRRIQLELAIPRAVRREVLHYFHGS